MTGYVEMASARAHSRAVQACTIGLFGCALHALCTIFFGTVLKGMSSMGLLWPQLLEHLSATFFGGNR